MKYVSCIFLHRWKTNKTIVTNSLLIPNSFFQMSSDDNSNNDPTEVNYYKTLHDDIVREKAKSKQRTEKKEIKFIENGPLRRSTYSRRGQSIVLAVSMEFTSFSFNIKLNEIQLCCTTY